MPRREMRSGARPAISRPSSLTLPELGARSPDSMLMSVDLPAPLGPITAWISPMPSSNETAFVAVRPPKLLVSAATRRTGSAIALASRTEPLQGTADAARQQQNGEDDEAAHRQEPMFGEIGEK